MSYHGDIRLGNTIDFKFTTRQATGAPFTLAGTPAVAAYVGNGTTEITAGITLTTDFDARTGLNHVRVVASSGNGFATGTDVELVLTAGTVNSVSVVGEVIGSFSIENRSALMPTTGGRTLDVGATGEGEANLIQVNGVAATSSGGRPEVNTTHIAGSAVNTASAQLGVNVVNFGGSAGTFAGGRPEVNASHWRGTALAVPTVAGVPAVETIDISAAGQTDIRAAVGLAAANLDTQLDALPTAAENATAVGGITLTELAAIPGASPALKDALALLYMALRNKRETTATDDIICNDAGTGIATATLSDDGTTFTKGEYA